MVEPYREVLLTRRESHGVFSGRTTASVPTDDSWDKQLSALFGRYVWLPLMDVSCEVPAPYANVPEDQHLQPAILDAKYIEIFNAQIGVSAVLTLALRSVIHRPLFPETKFLDQLVDKMWGDQNDEQDLKEVEKQLEKWRA